MKNFEEKSLQFKDTLTKCENFDIIIRKQQNLISQMTHQIKDLEEIKKQFGILSKKNAELTLQYTKVTENLTRSNHKIQSQNRLIKQL